MKADKLSFTVAPYALYDTLRALEIESIDNRYNHITYAVTKEDNDLVVVVTTKAKALNAGDANTCTDGVPKRVPKHD